MNKLGIYFIAFALGLVACCFLDSYRVPFVMKIVVVGLLFEFSGVLLAGESK
jgi:hypothetical protein